MLLLDTKMPISLDEIARRIGGFPDSPSARHQAFERAKKELRELGIPIATRQIPGDEQYGYKIEASEMIVRDLRFTDEEASALAAASALVSFGGGSRDSALQKLGCVISGGEATVASVPDQPALFRIFEAMGVGKAVQFTYRSKLRSIDIYGISFRWGNWYLIGNERESGFVKTFLVDRIESEVVVSELKSPDKPREFDVSSYLPRNRWEVGNTSLRADVVVRSDIAPLLLYEVGQSDKLRPEPGENGRFSLEVADSSSFFDWLLGYFDKIKLLGPDFLVKEFIGRLEGLDAELSASDECMLASFSDDFLNGVASQNTGKVQDFSSGSSSDLTTGGTLPGDLRSAVEMYSALVRMLPWLARKRFTTVEEISRIFGVGTADVVRLLEIAACCGLPPYTPDSLLEIIVEDDGTVESYLDMEIITAPRKLTTLEAMVLATIASTVIKVPGIRADVHLASALAKLERSLSKFEIALSEVDVGIEEPFFLADLRAAVDEHMSVEITYFSGSSERISRRLVDPYQLFTEAGRWYLRGFCHLAGEVRHFSVGRVISCESTDSIFDTPASELHRITSGEVPRAFEGAGQRVVLAVPQGTGWLVERLSGSPQYLGRRGAFDVFLVRAASRAWILKLMVRLAPNSHILSPAELKPLKHEAVQMLLDVYRKL